VDERPSRFEFAIAPPIGIALFGAALILAVIAEVMHPAIRPFAVFVVAFPLIWIALTTIATMMAVTALRMAGVSMPTRTSALSSFRLRFTLALDGFTFPAIGVLTSARFSMAGVTMDAGPWAEIPILSGGLAGTSQWDVTTNRRGILFVGPFRASIELPGSVVRVTAVFDTKHVVTVLPAIYQLEAFVDALLAGRHAAAGRFEKRPTAIEEYVGVREYRPGDSPKLIHRVLSLRTRDPNEFFVREFQDPSREDFSLVLDTAPPLDGDEELHNYRLEKAICFAYALCRTFATRRLTVRFICQCSARDVASIRLRPRDVDLDRLRLLLATIELQGDRAMIGRVLVDAVRRSGTSVIFVSLRRREDVEQQRLGVVTLTPDHVPAFTREVIRQ
jgi:uncharacterized protein (DUF58 family)